MKNLCTLAFSCLLTLLVAAQSNELFVKSGDNGLYLEHKVSPKQGFFSIGRIYNVHPRFLAAFNKLDYNKGLQIDQKIRIPLTDTNFSQTKGSGTPVYYRTGEKEGLMAVSRKNKNVLLSNLRWWNKLSSDELKKDTKLIIGFLQGSELPSITISGKPKNEEPPVKEEEPPVVVKPQDNPVVKPQDSTVVVKQPEEKKKDTVAIVKAPDPLPVNNVPRSGDGLGFFKSFFEQQVRKTPLSKEETVTSGIFKTLSGWEDGKYYLLIDEVPAGTIVRVTNPTTGKSVYAKVLGEMAGIRQNQGLDIRVSNAAASVLGVTDTEKFILKINY